MFIGATRGRRFRAFDAKSGKELLVTWTLLSRNARHILSQRWQGVRGHGLWTAVR
jgi:hypothetical protein